MPSLLQSSRALLSTPVGALGLLLTLTTSLGLFWAGLALPWVLALSPVIGLAWTLLAFATGLAPRALARHRDQTRQRTLRARRDALEQQRKRLTAMRLPDADIAQAVRGFALVFGDYLNTCANQHTRDPHTDVAAEEVLDTLTIYLRERDGAAIERHFDLPDADPFPDAHARTLAFIQERSAQVRQAQMNIEGGLGGHDRLSIREELQ